MGNFCCSEDLRLTSKCEEHYLDASKSSNPEYSKQMSLHLRLETVKEDQREYSEQSDQSKTHARHL